ncbi:peptidylprolyl isomerase [Bryobacter aggregatus]|uniref:peptidylprolyl isomerase n=1 Tax=Bryobacter aggregatus TaxID=360054 RepID=UPI00068A275C|nr:peptidylprolyl isomerase [Bryobacter aggregatus]
MLRLSFLFCCALFTVLGQTTSGPTVRFETNLGNIDVLLLPGSAPKTVENFLAYMKKGAYNNSVFHRSVPGFIVQGGGFQATLPGLPAIAQSAAVVNEFKESNIRGTIAMAKLGDDPNSATNQWFFNLANNAANLNGQNGGFTVFGRVVDNASLSVMDKIAAINVPSPGPLASPFDQIPLIAYSGGTVQQSNLVIVTKISEIPTQPAPSISDGGVVSATAFGAYSSAAPGSFLEIYGSNLAGEVTRGWSSDDFTNNTAPTSLEGVSVTVGGQRAFVTYVSPTQVNVQVPATVSVGIGLPVVVTYKTQQSAQVFIDMKLLNGGLLAPASYIIGGKQFVYAAHADGNPVNAASPAKPGETIIFYGTGFGSMSPFNIPIAGQIATALGTLQYKTLWKIGGADASVSFQGVTPGFVGLYQFNVTVPPDANTGDLSLEVTQNNKALPQTLLLPVRR